MRLLCGYCAVLFILFALAGESFAAVLPIDPPIERVLTAADGRSLEARIIGVSADSVELERKNDSTRFTLPLARLSEQDQTYLAELHREAKASQPLPDTAFLQLVRKDFVRASADRKKTEQLPSNAFAKDRWLLLAVHDYNYSSATAPWAGRHLDHLHVEQLPVLWMVGSADGLTVELMADSLPERHAVLNEKEAQAARELTRKMTEKVINDSYRRKPPKSGDVWYPFADEAAEAAFEKQVLAKLPAYWTRLPEVAFNERRREVSPHVLLCRRDGKPAIFRGQPITGSLFDVVTVLRKHEAEIE